MLGFLLSKNQKIARAEKKILNMYLQAPDRQYYLHQLRELGGEDAARTLIRRFTVSCENTTIDRDEKELTCLFLVEMGNDAIGPLKQYLRHNDQCVNWPFRALRDLLTKEQLIEFLAEVLDSIGPEYVRDPERKEQLVLTAKEFEDERIGRAVLPYLDDDNETIRFIAAETVVTHGFDFAIPELWARFAKEDSQRIKALIARAFVDKGWVIEDVPNVEPHLPSGFAFNRNKTLKAVK